MKPLSVTGVPEHFNLPWHLAKEEGLFEAAGIDLEWRFEKGGTGAMTHALDSSETDLAVLLTEGITAAIVKGSQSRILQKYIESPLIWGIHTGSKSGLSQIGDIEGEKYAISRKGSGSHLMAQVDAHNKNQIIDESQWVIVKNLDGALDSLGANQTQVFFWEKFTTLPFVKSGRLKRLGECVTPWPCFVIAASENALESKEKEIIKVLDIINSRAQAFMLQENAIDLVSSRYDLSKEDASAWFYQTEWAGDNPFRWKTLQNVIQTLLRCKVIDRPVEPSELCSPISRLNP